MHSLWEWWIDVIIPTAGAIGIPILVWILTRYYGADQADARKELQQLRDNLNFLISVSFSCLNSLESLKNRLLEIRKREKNALTATQKGLSLRENFNIGEICYGFVFDNMYNNVDISKYAGCIKHNEDFVERIVLIKSLLNSIDAYILGRNDILASIGRTENDNLRFSHYESFIQDDYKNMEKFLYDVYRIILLIKFLLLKISDLNLKIKKLSTIDVAFTENQLHLFDEADKGFKKGFDN